MSENILKVAILGAAGESGGLILDGLLASENPRYEVAALVRPSSADKPEYARLATRGVKLIPINLEGPEPDIAHAVKGQDVVIASVPPNVLDCQLPLARASKLANVKRFVPSSFAMALTPNGISSVQIQKEKIYAELEAIGLPWTIIDLGWWYNGFIPQLPSGKTDYALAVPEIIKGLVPGDGDMKTYAVDPDDIGKFVALILADPNTIKKRVMASGCAISFNEVSRIVEKLTGEKPQLKHVSATDLQSMIDEARIQYEKSPENYFLAVCKFCLEYYYSSYIHGDNSPEGAERLGYILATDLYPDMEPTSFEQFFQDVLDKKKRVPYTGRF